MARWNPGQDPFPATAITDITDLEYLDELKFARHARVHVKKTPQSLWQLSADCRAGMELVRMRAIECTGFLQKFATRRPALGWAASAVAEIAVPSDLGPPGRGVKLALRRTGEGEQARIMRLELWRDHVGCHRTRQTTCARSNAV